MRADTPAGRRALRTALVRWYRANERDLPWRRTRDPYAVWVSEIMLQQTRVETVIPYYLRFLERFPTAGVLADASRDAVLSVWSGLGYYRRARMLHAGARVVVDEHGGRVPEDAAARRAIPGIGRYTAGAIGSIAFDREEPIVDGNVARVLSRVHAIETPLGKPETEKRLWAEAEALVRGDDPGALNQALMELGATVCTPTSPRCGACPIRAWCRAEKESRTESLPVARVKKPPVARALVALVARTPKDDAVWLVRGEGTLFGGLFGAPMAEGRSVEDAHALLAVHGLRGVVERELGVVEHVLTHRRLSVRVFAATASGRGTEARRRFDAAALRTVGISTLTKKILALRA